MAKFKKGQSRNPDGRPKGTINKLGLDLRKDITDFLTDNFDVIVDEFNNIKSSRDKIRLFIDLMQYGLPKLQSIEMTSDIDKLSDEEVNKIYEKLKEQVVNEKLLNDEQ